MSDELKKENPGLPEGETGEAMLLRMNEHHKPLRDWGFSFIDWRPGMEILDIGCGGGAAIQEMLKLSEGSIVKGIDHSYKSVEMSVKLNAKAIAYERCSIKIYDVMKMPYIDNAYDLVTAIETMYFWENPVVAFGHVKRVLKPGGEFVILNEACDPAAAEGTDYKTPMTIYTEDEIKSMMEEAGFRNCEARRGEGENIMVTGIK